jgi:hypothetical protein
MEEFLNHPEDQLEDNVTLESLAWKLLMDENVEDYAGVLLPSIINYDSSEDIPVRDYNAYDNLADQFQMLITIYMEMVFGLLKINHISANLDKNGDLSEHVDLEKTFDPDLSIFTVNDLVTTFREKLKKIRVFVSVHEIIDQDDSNDGSNQSNQFGNSDKYYCRILFRNTIEGKTFYRKNRDILEPDKQYMFAIRSDNERKHTKLNDFYAVCALPHMKVKISFSPINIILKDTHQEF